MARESSSLTAHPPMLPDDLCPPPASILLDLYGYISDRTNATTADGFTKGGKRIKVTFWAARPPHGSYFTFCSPDMEISAFADVPRILCTEDDLVLLRFPICPSRLHLDPRKSDYFIYQAGGKEKPPSLELIPSPPVFSCSDSELGLLPCRNRDMYIVSVLQHVLSHKGLYNLHMYNSKTKTWTTKLMQSQKAAYWNTSKVITIGGEHGSVGWVDLWQGILVCDLLLDSHELGCIPLLPVGVNEAYKGPPLRFRDVIVCDGGIKLLKMDKYFGPCGVTDGWQMATYVWKDSSSNWVEDCSIKLSEDSVQISLSKDSVLPCSWDDEPVKQLTLNGLFSGYPALSLHDADVVYIMDREGFLDHEALVIAVNLRKHTVTGVAMFRSGRPLGYSFTYLESRVSKYLHHPQDGVTNYDTHIGNSDEIINCATHLGNPGKGIPAGDNSTGTVVGINVAHNSENCQYVEVK